MIEAGKGAEFWVELPVKFDRSFVSPQHEIVSSVDFFEGLNAMDGDRERCMEVDMDTYVAKPFDHIELMDTVRNFLPSSSKQIELDKDALGQIRQLEKSGQPSILNQVIDAYLDASPAVLAALLDGVQDADAKAIEFNAHTLKSGSASLGATNFSKLCLRFEKVGRSGVLDEASSLIETLQSEFLLVCEALARERLPQ